MHHSALQYNLDFRLGLYGKYKRVLELIRPTSTILELGCSTGYFSKELVRHGHDVVAFDVDEKAVSVAKGRGINAHVLNLSGDAPFADVQPRRFDYVLAMDILEHMARPDVLLADLRAVVASEGRLLVTGPNVAYWAVRAKLALGRWEYDSAGVMDETHLRWFTRKTWGDLLVRAGYAILRSESVEGMVPKEQWLRGFGVSAPKIESVRRCALRLAPDLFTTVFLFEASLASEAA